MKTVRELIQELLQWRCFPENSKNGVRPVLHEAVLLGLTALDDDDRPTSATTLNLLRISEQYAILY